MSLEKTIKVHGEFIEQMDKKIKDKTYNFGNASFDIIRRRLECELYEWTMARENLWEPSKVWDHDGKSDKYGKVDVKTIGLNKFMQHNGQGSGKPWWNISRDKMWNICRQYGIVDHWYFIKWVDRPDGLLVENDEVTIEFIGVMNFEQVMKNIQKSSTQGFYIDTRKARDGEGQ